MRSFGIPWVVQNLTSTERKEIVYDVVNETEHNHNVLTCAFNETAVLSLFHFRINVLKTVTITFERGYQ